MISQTVQRIGTSPTLKISAKAKAMRAEGIDVVDLSVGEPDFPTPANVKAAGIKAIEANFTKYTEGDGTPALRKAILQRLKEDHGLSYAMNEVIVSDGAKSSLFHAVQALVDEGEEVILPAPYWVTYPECVALAKGKTVVVPTREEDGFLLTPERLKAAITPATKALILNNPSNPTGAAYTKAQLQALADVLRGEDIYVIADEIYGKLVFDGFKFTSFPTLGEDVKRKTILIDGVSKSYSMTGWRIGFAAGPADVISGMSKMQSHTTSAPASMCQRAAQEALSGPQHEVGRMVAEFQRRRNYCLMRLATVRGLSCYKPQGAFYLFPNVRRFYEMEFNGSPIRNSYGMAYHLLKEARTAIVPGDSFGADDFIRLSYATSMENLEKAMDRVVEALGKLQPARKRVRVFLANAATRVRAAVPVEAVDLRMRDALVAEMDGHLGYENVYAWNANIQGAVVRLKTNAPHLNDFWMENWYPAQLEADVEPHGAIYAVDGVAGREPRAFYNAETKTAVVVNTDLYAPLRSLALGLVMDVAERMFSSFAVRGMSVDDGGRGLLLVGPPGTKKTDLFFGLLKDPRFRLHANEAVFVRAGDGRPTADAVERKLYIPTATVEDFGRLAPLFDRSKCENVVVRRDDCKDQACLRGDDCRLDRGAAFCYKAAKDAHAMLDPSWISGPQGVVRRTQLRWLFLLRNDAFSPAAVELGKDEALRVIEAGEGVAAASSLTPPKAQPFYNPHLLGGGPERLELHRSYMRRLLGAVTVIHFNSGVAGVEKIKEIIS